MLTQIKASAGSGKTYTLTQRFLALLAQARAEQKSPCVFSLHAAQPAAHYSFTEILAATFTNKAAAEMKSRVMQELKLLALQENVQASSAEAALFSSHEAAAWVHTILRQYGSLNIRTIDSLLVMLVRLSALGLKLPPDFTPQFGLEKTLDPLYDALLHAIDAGDVVLEEALHAACRSTFFYGKSKGFASAKPLRERLYRLLTFTFSQESLPVVPESHVRQRFVDLHRDVVASTAQLQGLIVAEKLQLVQNCSNFLQYCLEWPAFTLPEKISAYADKENFDACLLKVSKGKASLEAEQAYLEFSAAVLRLWADGALLLDALQYIPFLHLAAPLWQGLEALQQEHGMVPAERIPYYARQVLSGDVGLSEAFCRMGSRLTHLLLDEFQDTSRDQWAALQPLAVECLSRGGSLSYVGDIKQAIYSWRGGDAALFTEVVQDPELLAIFPEPLCEQLPHNWRSAPAIVQHNNSIFSQLAEGERAGAVLRAMLPKGTPEHIQQETVQTLLAAFSGAAQTLPPQKTPVAPGYVRLTRVHKAKQEELELAIKEQLQALFSQELLLRYAPEDIAVLVRSNKEASLLAEWLAEWHIPVVTENSFRLAVHPLVQQLTAFLRFLEYPLDAQALWEVLSGSAPSSMGNSACLFPPEAQCPDLTELSEQLAGFASAVSKRPLYMSIRQQYPQLWQQWFAPFFSASGQMSAYDMVREVVRLCRLETRFPQWRPFVYRFLEFVFQAEQQGARSLAAFLHVWETARDTEMVPTPEGISAVRIVTIHKSKGLEFPVVVIPFQHPRNQTSPDMALLDVAGVSVLSRLLRAAGDPWFYKQASEACEALHLLYVAWTRPIEELHAFVSSTTDAEKFSSFFLGLQELVRGLELDNDGASYETGVARGNSMRHLAPAVPTQERMPEEILASEMNAIVAGSASKPWRPMQWLPRLKVFRNQLEEFAFTERRRGMLVHRCLEFLRYSDKPELDVAAAVQHGMRSFPLPVPDAAVVAHDVRDCLHWVRSLPHAALWLQHGLVEQSIMDATGALHRMDLLVQTEQENLVVDYKTGQADGTVVDEHREQVLRYLRLLQQTSTVPCRGLLLYIDARKVEEIVL